MKVVLMKNPGFLRQSADAFSAAMDASRVIAARTPMILASAGGSTPAEAVELRRMVNEKSQAGAEGAQAAGAAMGSLWLDAMFGRIRTPGDLANGLGGIVEAAMRPARKKVKANAKRLAKRR